MSAEDRYAGMPYEGDPNAYVSEAARLRSALSDLLEAAERVDPTTEFSAGEGCVGCGLSEAHREDCWFIALYDASVAARDVLGGEKG